MGEFVEKETTPGLSLL